MMDSDHPGPVRPGEELDADRLTAFLRARLDVPREPISIEQFPYGHSNLTYLVRCGVEAWVLRRPPFGNVIKSAHDMGREFRVLSKLCDVYPLAPRPLCFCDDESVMGVPFYLVERRHGVILRGSSPVGASLGPATARRVSTTIADELARLHSIDFQAAGLGDLGRPVGYVARQIAGWTDRYRKSQTHSVPAMDSVADWLAHTLPSDSGAALIHNDYKHDNLMFDPADFSRLVAVLDWEMCTIGDPLMDLGSTLGYWVEPGDAPELRDAALGPSVLPGSFSRREFVDRYAERSGRNVVNERFYYCYGLFKLAVIIQQIYARFARGLTRDDRFAKFDQRVVVISNEALRIAHGGDI